MMKKEIRCFDSEQLEIREEEGQEKRIAGYAAMFNKWSVDMGFREKIAQGAFEKSIDAGKVRALWNHNSDMPLGNQKRGTLTLDEDEKGLLFEIELPDNSWGRDAEIAIKRGDVEGMSFGFSVNQDYWDDSKPDKLTRTLLDVDLHEISPVTFPAYQQTSVSVRSADEVLEEYRAGQSQEDEVPDDIADESQEDESATEEEAEEQEQQEEQQEEQQQEERQEEEVKKPEPDLLRLKILEKEC